MYTQRDASTCGQQERGAKGEMGKEEEEEEKEEKEEEEEQEEGTQKDSKQTTHIHCTCRAHALNIKFSTQCKMTNTNTKTISTHDKHMTRST